MDKYSLIKSKIDSFFTESSKQLNTQKEIFKLLISFDGKLRYELYGINNAFHGYKKIEEIVKVSVAEKMLMKTFGKEITHEDIEKTLLQSITKIAQENNCVDQQIQLLLLPTNKYYAMHKRIKLREINLNEIL